MLEDIGGKAVAEAHKARPAKGLRSIILQYAIGKGRMKVEGWVPETMRFVTDHPQPEAEQLAA